MQVSATLIAAQQAAREARARLQMPQAPQQVAGPNFASALEKTSGVSGGFSALPLKQTAAPAAPAQPQQAAPARMGMHVDITV
jgi:hypothetical protein